MTLLDQINFAKKKRAEIALRLKEQDEVIRELEGYRALCKHEFAPAPKGYEHEGGTCKLCGINELYAHTLQKQK